MTDDTCVEAVVGHFDQSSYKLYFIPVQQLGYVNSQCTERATDWTTGDSGLDSTKGRKFLYSNFSTSAPWPHLATYTVSTESCFPEIKATEREADYYSESRVEVKNVWGYNSTPPYVS